jgi:predicted deacylase
MECPRQSPNVPRQPSLMPPLPSHEEAGVGTVRPATDIGANEEPRPDDLADVEPAPPEPSPASAFELLGSTVLPGERRQLRWTAGQSFAGRAVNTPVLVVHGTRPGPKLCLTAAIHGDELNGVSIVRQVISGLDPTELNGTVIGVPIVNLLGFTRGSRYLPDRRDLNRYFPGNPRGSAASRIANLFFEQLVRHCDRLVDIHTGSQLRANMPQLRADLHVPEVLEFTKHFGATAVLHHSGGVGTLRKAATDAGIPAVTFELGEPNTLQPTHAKFGIKAIETLLHKLDMIERFRLWSEPQPIYYASRWVRADYGGILISNTKLGARVRAGDVIGTVANPITDEEFAIRAPWDGRILGMALNQFVLPGFAAFHIGIAAQDSERVGDDAELDISADTEQEPDVGDLNDDDDMPADGEPADESEYH